MYHLYEPSVKLLNVEVSKVVVVVFAVFRNLSHRCIFQGYNQRQYTRRHHHDHYMFQVFPHLMSTRHLVLCLLQRKRASHHLCCT